MGKKRKILLVDDDEFLLAMYSKKLRESGVEVETLENATDDFVKKVLEIKPDLVVLDIIMPVTDGFVAIKMLKDDPRTKDIPVIFESNLREAEVINKGISLGAIDYLIIACFTPEEMIKCFLNFLNDPQHYVKRYPEFIKEEKIPKISDKIKKRVRLAIELLVLFLIIAVDIEPALKGKILVVYLMIFGFGRIKDGGAYSITGDFRETFETAKKRNIFSIVMIIGLSIIALAFAAMAVGIVYAVLSAYK